MTTALMTPVTETGKPNARTEAALERLRKAMRDIEAEVLANNGIYPFNYGRVTQSELCRRADVKKPRFRTRFTKTRHGLKSWAGWTNWL